MLQDKYGKLRLKVCDETYTGGLRSGRTEILTLHRILLQCINNNKSNQMRWSNLLHQCNRSSLTAKPAEYESDSHIVSRNDIEFFQGENMKEARALNEGEFSIDVNHNNKHGVCVSARWKLWRNGRGVLTKHLKRICEGEGRKWYTGPRGAAPVSFYRLVCLKARAAERSLLPAGDGPPASRAGPRMGLRGAVILPAKHFYCRPAGHSVLTAAFAKKKVKIERKLWCQRRQAQSPTLKQISHRQRSLDTVTSAIIHHTR